MAYKDDLRDFIIAQNYRVKLYRQNLDKAEFPDEVEKLLDEYVESNFLEEDLMEAVESDFPIGIVKKITAKVTTLENQLTQPSAVYKKKLYLFLANIFRYRVVFVFCLILSVACVYNFTFRYKYRTYKDSVGRVQVIKIDKLTGKSIFYYPEYKMQKEK